LKPVAAALAANGILPTLVFTGQHRSLSPGEFGLDLFPAVFLGCSGTEDPHEHVRAATTAFIPLLSDSPDLIVVQGDTSSALGAALAAFIVGVPVAHVEAGLRTHDPMLPWPEEEYRCAIDADADLLFAPTELAAANLRAEQVPGEIYVTGNTGIDAVLETASRLPPQGLHDRGKLTILVTCHRRESWHDGLQSIAAALIELACIADVRIEFVLHPNAYVAGSVRRLLDGAEGVSLIDPCDHEELLLRMRDATIVLCDSGGIQEEAPALGVPLLVLREKTERPEGIAAGTALLVGTDKTRIVTEARRLIEDPAARAAMSRKVFPFGNGQAAPRIAEIIDRWLEQTSLTRRLA
jgi:UDP-N-acetylglucosamine 2-epimerase (non-hydrolysing)